MRVWKVPVLAVTAAIALAGTDAEPSLDATATRTGDTVTVTGIADLPSPGRTDVGAFITGFSEPDIGTAVGIDLVGASIEPIDGGLRFYWEMSSLPPDVPPEAVRYNWAFSTPDGQVFQLQAKRTNLASVTTVEDPAGHVLQAPEGEYFQLRGNCQAAYLGTPMNGCYHLAFLEGGVDADAGEVWMDLPFRARDGIGRLVAESFVSGTRIQASTDRSAGMSIAASLQAVVSNTATSQYAAYWTPYYTGPAVEVAVGPANAAIDGLSFAPATLAEDGSFAGAVTGEGDTAFVRGCYGPETDCVTIAVPIG